MVWLFCNCHIAKQEIRREVEKSFLMVDGHTIDRVDRQHIDLGCTPGGWLKKGTVDVQLWSGGGFARTHHMVLPGSDPVLLVKKFTCTPNEDYGTTLQGGGE